MVHIHACSHNCFKCKERVEERGRGEREEGRKEGRKGGGRTSRAPPGQEYVWAAVPSSSVFLFGNVLCTTNESTEEEGGEKEKGETNGPTTGAAEVSLTGWGISRSKR